MKPFLQMDGDELIRLRQLAIELQRHPATVRRWGKRAIDPLPVLRLPGGDLVRVGTAREWLRRNFSMSAADPFAPPAPTLAEAKRDASQPAA